MGDFDELGRKLNVTSPRIIRKAREFSQLLQIRNSSSSLAALKLSGSCKDVVCLELAASKHQHVIDKTNAIRVSGMPKKMYITAMKTIESMLDLQETTSIRDLAVQFTCTQAVDLAVKVLKKYEDEQKLRGDDLDYNTTLFQGAALCAACRKLKIRIDKAKVKEHCAVKKSSFETLLNQMEKIADNLEDGNELNSFVGEKKVTDKRRGTTLIDEIEKRIQDEVPEKRRKSNEEEEEQVTDYEEWKRKILANAAKAKAAS